MEAVLNFTGIVEIEFTGAMKLRSYILYPVNTVCCGRDEDGARRGSILLG
ncbi:unnamed protein product [Brassica rapa]|uniref:Uncharacterized protein n=1 Tax=Brassica campestris TaxID=3711 RepID=A0A8D9CZT6_BRACM|nr:unnamed protein product [Brassica rapa]